MNDGNFTYIRYDSIIGESDKALLLNITRNVTSWIPKSQLEFAGKNVFKIPYWLTVKKGFITTCPERMLSPAEIDITLNEAAEKKKRIIDV